MAFRRGDRIGLKLDHIFINKLDNLTFLKSYVEKSVAKLNILYNIIPIER